MSDRGYDLPQQPIVTDGKEKLSELEEVIWLCGRVKARMRRLSELNATSPLTLIADKYGRTFYTLAAALEFMTERVEEKKQEARNRMAALRRAVP